MTVQGIPVYLPESVQQEIFEELLKLTLQAVEKAKKEMQANTNGTDPKK
jgi:hypothetical protein